MDRWTGSRFLTIGLLGSHLFLGGCKGAEPIRAPGFQPDFTTLLKMPGSESAVLRAQKAEQKAIKSFLEMGTDVGKDVPTIRIRATVNGEAILDEEVHAAAFQLLPSARSEKEKADILNEKLNEIIERELLMQDAMARLSKKGGLRFLKELETIAEREYERQWLFRLMRANNQSDPVLFSRLLRDQGVPVDLIKRSWVRNFIAMEYVRTRIDPNMMRIGHVETVEYYEKNPDHFKVEDHVVWQDIFIANAKHPSPQAARKFAEVLVERIRKGEDFVRLAKQFDNGDSSLRENAEGIGHKRSEIMPRDAEPALFALKDGQVGPLIEMETGYHIIKLVKRTYAGKRPFDELTQKSVRDKLKGQVFQQEMRKLINDLKRLAIIDVARDVR